MIPRPEFGSLARRTAFLGSVGVDLPADTAPGARPELWASLQMRRALLAQNDDTVPRIERLLKLQDGSRAYLVPRMLDAIFGISGAIATRTWAHAGRLAQVLTESLIRAEMQDAVLSRTRAIDVLPFARDIVDLVNAFRGEITAADDPSLTGRMRTALGLSQFYSTLTNASRGDSIASAAQKLHAMPLTTATFRVVLGHMVPLVRTIYDGAVAQPLLANLEKWLADMGELRRAYVQQYRREADLPAADETRLPETENDLYTLALNAELTRVANASLRDDDEPIEPLADIVYFDKSFNEVATVVVRRAGTCWAKDPRVHAAILRLATRIRSLRLLVGPILDEVFFSETSRSTDVEIAGIEMAASFSGGFRRDEARFEAAFLFVSRGEGQYRPLEDDLRAIFESDEAVHERLGRIASDPAGRTPAVRGAAFRALLDITTAPDEQQRLFELATAGDPPLVRVFLEWVIAGKAHGAFEFVRRVDAHARAQQLEPLLFEAVAATGHVEAAHYLRQAGAGSEFEARIEELLRRRGAEGVVDEMVAHRRIRHNIAEANDLSAAREAAINREAQHKMTAVREASAAMAEQLAADRAVAERHMAMTLSIVEHVREVITLEKHLHRLADLVQRVPPLRNELSGLQENLRDLARQHNVLVAAINRAYGEVQSMERLHEKHGQTITNNERQINRVRGDIRQAEADASRASQRISGLQRDLASASDENAASSIRQRIRSAESEINSSRSRIRSAGQEIRDLGDQNEELKAAMRQLRGNIDVAEREIQAANGDIERNRNAHRDVRRRYEATQQVFNRLLREIDEVRGDVRSTEGSIRDVHRRREERVSLLEGARVAHAERQVAHQNASAAAIRAADRERQHFIDLSSRIAELESQNAQLLATVQQNRQNTAEQLATIDANARVAEQQHTRLLRVRQSVQLNIDLLMSIVKTRVNPGAEVRNVLEKMEKAR